MLARDGASFVGRYGSGEWWTGARLAADPDAGAIVDLTSPRAAMRTFLDGGNAARYDAPDEMVRAAAAVDFGGTNLLPEERLSRTKALFDAVDATTFRLVAIPDAATGDSAGVTLQQAGNDVELPLHFRRTGERWAIAMPDAASLAASSKALFARYGGHPPGPEDYRLRRTPSDTFRLFARAFTEWDSGGKAEALSTLDLSGLPPAIRDYQGDLTVLYLNGILSRIGLPLPQEIPDDPASTTPYVFFTHPAGQIVVAPAGTGKPATWAFTRETVRDIRKLFLVMEDLPRVDGRVLPAPFSAFLSLRRWIRSVSPSLLSDLGPLELWQAIGWAGVLAISLALGRLVTEGVMRLALRLLGTRDARADRRTFRYAVWGVAAFSIYKLIIPVIGLADQAKQVSVGVTGVLLVASLMWLGWITVDAVGERFFSTDDGHHVTMDNIVLLLLFGVLKLALVAVGLVLIAIELSLPYEGIIASLSIGGLAVAFASRETLSNVFGAGVLAIDRPFKRGDYIAAGGIEGTVENVGIRSTRVRTSDDSLIIVPNGKLSDAFVNNLGSRRYHLGSLKLPLPFDIGATQLEQLMDGARGIVDAVPEIERKRTALALSTIGTDGIQLALSYSIDVTRGGSDTAITNRLVLDVLRLCERLGIHTATGVGRAAA